MDYYVVSQGKTTIPGVDDDEEMTLTDVRPITVSDDGFFILLVAEPYIVE